MHLQTGWNGYNIISLGIYANGCIDEYLDVGVFNRYGKMSVKSTRRKSILI